MADPAIAGCGAFGDLGTHVLDILLWLFGDVERVIADINVVTGRYGECDESGEGLMKFTSGVVGTLAAGWVDVANPVTLMVSGTEGHAHVDNGQLYFQSSKVAGADGKQPWTDLPPAWPHAFELFLDAVMGKQDVPLVSPTRGGDALGGDGGVLQGGPGEEVGRAEDGGEATVDRRCSRRADSRWGRRDGNERTSKWPYLSSVVLQASSRVCCRRTGAFGKGGEGQNSGDHETQSE